LSGARSAGIAEVGGGYRADEMDAYRASTYGDAFADVYDDWYGALPGLDAAIGMLAGLAAGGGRLLELGCGTGRLCLPLAARGLDVHGLDASAAMLERLRAKPGAAAVRAHVADMADFDLRAVGPFALVFVAFNSLFNIPSADGQARCFATVADHLAESGRFVVECFVPGDAPERVRDAVDLHTLTTDRVVLRVSRQDPEAQTVAGQHVEITEGGIRLRPWHLRYASPSELDAMAAAAGLEVAARHGDWSGAPFTEDSSGHVTVYARAPRGGDRP
jgi:SAM-dependent methyltransferase